MLTIFRRGFLCASGALLVAPLTVLAQQGRVYRVGVIYFGGIYEQVVGGLRDGLKALGFEEGKQFIFHLRDARGDPKLVATMAKGLESERVDLICSVTTTATQTTKRETKSVPIVFYAGNDPVAAGLVAQMRKPGGRVTGVYSRFTDLTGKRLELLKEMAPKKRRFVIFHSPQSTNAQNSLRMAREAARRLNLEIVERPFASAEEFRAALRALRPGEADAFGYMSDVTVISQSDLIIATAKTNRMMTMFADRADVVRGGLASYGQSYYAIGQMAAKLVHQVLLGADPGNIAIEQVDKIHFAINLNTAKALGLTIPQSILARADEVIQ